MHNQEQPTQTQKYTVSITETLKMTVEVEADDPQQAKQFVTDDGWYASKYILDADNFADVDFEVL